MGPLGVPRGPREGLSLGVVSRVVSRGPRGVPRRSEGPGTPGPQNHPKYPKMAKNDHF